MALLNLTRNTSRIFALARMTLISFNATLDLVPELRICAAAAKRARRMALNYPLRSAESVCELLGGEIFEGAGYRIRQGRYFPLYAIWLFSN